jgi:hypothetical protein
MLARGAGRAQRRLQGSQRRHWSLIADLSAFIQANPVANPDEEDLEPDGTWCSMISIDGALYPMDSNHGGAADPRERRHRAGSKARSA